MDTIQNEGTMHKYFHQMLNMAEDDLDPFEYRLLGHYIRWSGDGRPFKEGITKTAKKTKMNKETCKEARAGLAAKGYLILTEQPSRVKGQANIAAVVLVCDRWAENISRYSPYAKNSIGNQPAPMPKTAYPPMPDLANIEELSTKEKKKTTNAAQNAAITDLIKSWLDASGTIDPAAYGKKPFRNLAKAMVDANITPTDVAGYVAHLKTLAYFNDKNVPLGYVASNITAWLKTRPSTPNGAGLDRTAENTAAWEQAKADNQRQFEERIRAAKAKKES